MDIAQLIQTVALYALPVLFAITVHEAAHGYAARHFGDNTAYAMGRVTLNPIKHIDPIGTILMPLMLYFATSGAFLFGYAKPVPVRFGNLRNPKRDMIWVALAGPGANFVQAFIWGVLFFVLRGTGVTELDGGRILVGLLPYRQAVMVSRIEPWGFFIVMALVLAGIVSTLWMQPLMTLTFGILDILLTPVSMIFG